MWVQIAGSTVRNKTRKITDRLERPEGGVLSCPFCYHVHTYDQTQHNNHSISGSENRPKKISQSAEETTQARERRICLCLCLSDPNRSFISVLL